MQQAENEETCVSVCVSVGGGGGGGVGGGWGGEGNYRFCSLITTFLRF